MKNESIDQYFGLEKLKKSRDRYLKTDSLLLYFKHLKILQWKCFELISVTISENDTICGCQAYYR